MNIFNTDDFTVYNFYATMNDEKHVKIRYIIYRLKSMTFRYFIFLIKYKLGLIKE